jgi:hypothetical protein
VLQTGALWKGPIGTLDIILTFPYEAVSPNVLSVTPSGYTIQGNKILYQLKNFEPTTNIEVEFLPFDFYGKIKLLEDKALKTNSPTDWFNYALALFPNNPLGRLDRFANWYQTSAFKDYVSDVLEKALSLQKEGSSEYIILKEIYDAHFSPGMPFIDGYDSLLISDANLNIPSDALKLFNSDLYSIGSRTEGKIFGYLLDYVVYADLKQGNTSKALSDLKKSSIINGYFNNIEENFETSTSAEPPSSSNNEIKYVLVQSPAAVVKNIAIIVLSVVVVALLAVIFLLLKKRGKVQNEQ